MLPTAVKKEMVERLRREILAVEGLQKQSDDVVLKLGLPQLEAAFPEATFPLGNIHEFISTRIEGAAATTGFMAALLSRLITHKNPCAWVSRSTHVFPPGLTLFGMPADNIIFIRPSKDKDLLWATEEALKCPAFTAVVADVPELDLTASRRLQLAVEQSRVTGLLHRYHPKKIENTASVARWQIQPANSGAGGVPGVGHPCWQVALLKVRNGKPGSWVIEWVDGQFKMAIPSQTASQQYYPYQNAG